MIVKYVETSHNGIQSQNLTRYAIGYVLRGTKYIYDGDQRTGIGKGQIFFWESVTTTSRTCPKRASPSSRS